MHYVIKSSHYSIILVFSFNTKHFFLKKKETLFEKLQQPSTSTASSKEDKKSTTTTIMMPKKKKNPTACVKYMLAKFDARIFTLGLIF